MALRTARLVLALAGALALAPLAVAETNGPFSGEKDIQLGDTVIARFTGEAGQTHVYWFFAPERTVVDVAATATSGSGVAPRLRLLRPGGDEVRIPGRIAARAGRATIARASMPFGGWFGIEVSGAGSGDYSLRTSGAAPAVLRTIATRAEPGEQVTRFRGLAGARVTVALSPRGASKARPEIVEIRRVDGPGVAVTTSPRGRGSVAEGGVLPESGTYEILWSNDGLPGDVDVAVSFLNAAPRRFGFEVGAAQGLPRTTVDTLNTGVPGGSALPGFAGSAVCGRCHDEIFRGWSETVHNLAVRDWRRAGLTGAAFVNDANGNGIDDFRDGLDLATVAAFSTYGALAPKLSYVAGDERPYKITIGPVTYDVVRTMGGNGQWKQRYLVLVGNHMYPSPVQYNDGPLSPSGTARYVTYDATDWYSGSAPTWSVKYTSASQLPKEKSFENRCSGCHNTGETITRDVATGDYVVGYTDFNIGCEQCHGPAAAHVADPPGVKPVNPRGFADGTAEGVRRANDVCGKCHTRGSAAEPFPALIGSKAGFPYSQGRGVPHVGPSGVNLAETFVATTSGTDFWGRKTDPFDATQGVWAASRSHRQQALDMQMGAHASANGWSPTCFDCHDPHFRRQKHQIRGTIAEAELDEVTKSRHDAEPPVRIPTRTADNSLCLSCHAGHGPYASLTKADAASIGAGRTTQAVKDAVTAHMKDIGMPVASSLYDPEGTKVGQCVSCHMPLLERTAISRTDVAGLRLGDEHSHAFHTVNPRVSQLWKDGTVGVSNSCNVCHPTSGNDRVDDIILQWSSDDADADGTFHADTPRSFQNGIANPTRNGGVWCAQCHTTAGFVAVQVKGESLDQARATAMVRDAIARDKGIACDACHGAKPDGTFGNEANPLRFEKKDLCQKCHNAQTVVFSDFQAYGEMVRHPQKEMHESTAGALVPGQGYGTTNPHRGGAFGDACASCHFDEEYAGASHKFDPQVAVCTTCHGEITSSFDRPGQAGRDWDGDGSVEGFQTEVTGLLDKLKTAILAADASVTFAGGYFDRSGASDHKLTGATDAVKRAAYNWYTVSGDASRGVHNPNRAVQLLQKSYRELTGTNASTNIK